VPRLLAFIREKMTQHEISALHRKLFPGQGALEQSGLAPPQFIHQSPVSLAGYETNCAFLAGEI
jgi:hypothetical protein